MFSVFTKQTMFSSYLPCLQCKRFNIEQHLTLSPVSYWGPSFSCEHTEWILQQFGGQSNSGNEHMCVQMKGVWSGAKWKDLGIGGKIEFRANCTSAPLQSHTQLHSTVLTLELSTLELSTQSSRVFSTLEHCMVMQNIAIALHKQFPCFCNGMILHNRVQYYKIQSCGKI